MPDRLPSLIVLVAFWVPPALAGWTAAGWRAKSSTTSGTRIITACLAAVVVAYAAAWFLFNLNRMPPYIPGATMDPTFATPEAVRGLGIFTALVVLPGSAVACALGFGFRKHKLRQGLQRNDSIVD